VTREISSLGGNIPGRLVVLPETHGLHTLQLDIYSDDWIPVVNKGEPYLERESPASLVFSLSVNGSVLVSASPHRSEASKPSASRKIDRPFVFDYIPDATYLTCPAGRQKVRGYLRDFVQLSCVTRARTLPSKQSGVFLQRLETRTHEYRAAYESRDEARRNWLGVEMNFGIGLVAGLIASTILPFAKDFGAERTTDLAAIRAQCLATVKDNSDASLVKCLESRQYYKLDVFASKWLTTGPLMMFALLFTLVALLILMRIKRKAQA
jgi:hypothetical protein